MSSVGTASLNYKLAIVNPDGSPNSLFITQWNSLRTDIGKAMDAAAATVAGSYQPLNASLTTIAGQTNTGFGLSLLTEASAPHLLGTTLSAYTKTETDSAISTALVPYITTTAANAAFQPKDATLTALAGLATGSDQLAYSTGTDAFAQTAFSSVARTLVGQATQALMRSTGLGLGTAATQNTGTSGANVPLLSTSNAWTLSQTFSANSQLFGGDTNTGTVSISINGAAGSGRYLFWRTAGVSRFAMLTTTSAESGSAAGSNFQFQSYDDAGAVAAVIFGVTRATGILNFTSSPLAPTPTAGDNSTKVPTTAMLVRDYQPLGSYVTYTAQTLTTPQQAQARTNINAQVAGTYATGTGSATGTNTGDQSFTATGDATAPSSTSTLALTLASTGVTAGSYGSTSVIPGYTVDAKGRITLVTSYTITPAAIGAQPAGTYATGTGTATGTNTGDETTATIKSKLSITTLSGSNTGDQTITLTGDVTGSGTGSFSASLATTQPSVHTWSLAQTFTVAPVFTDQPGTRTALGLGTLATQSGTFSGTSSGTNTGDQTITLTGDVTGSGTGSFAASIGANKVTLAQMAQVATATFLGRTTAATGNVEAMTVAQAKTLLNLTGTNSGDQTITLTGDVTGSGTGSFAATLVTAQPAAHTWAATQTFTVAPVFTDASGARTALGVAYGTTAGTVAQGNDSRITGAVQGATTATLTTTDATATSLLTPATASGSVAVVDGFVVARCPATGDTAAWYFRYCIKNVAGTQSLLGTATVTALGNDTGAASWVAAMFGVRIRVTGVAATTINWKADVRIVTVS